MAKLIPGVNDLATVNPDLAAEWHLFRNGSLTPNMVTKCSSKKVWWKCNKGHEWETVISNRSKGAGCPYCSGRKAISGETDLQTTNPGLAAQWHPTKNGDLTPQMVTVGSGKKVWWQCEYGHEWEAAINNRSLLKRGCPFCTKESQTSFPEQAILYYLRMATSAENRCKKHGKEIDIYLPELQAGIEYNGWYYHQNKEEKDAKKIAFFAEKNITIYSVNEGCQNQINGNVIEYRYSSSDMSALTWALYSLFDLLHLSAPDIDIISDSTQIYEQYIILKKENSFALRFPEMAKEWHPTKNGNITPDKITFRSAKDIWWQCEKGHEWRSKPSTRARGYKCPYCVGRIIIPGENDLGTLYPKLAKEWHPTKNGTTTPQNVHPGSMKRAWWKCERGHEWQAIINHRTRGNGTGCACCSGKRVILGETDLMTTNPALAAEWHPFRNEDLTPQMVMAGSNKKVWWLGKCGHEWEARVANRHHGTGCPYCSNNKILSGFNDLATKHPEIADQWHPTKNGDIKPNMVMPFSNKKAWWICEEGHEWEALINRRSAGSGCPVCHKGKHACSELSIQQQKKSHINNNPL